MFSLTRPLRAWRSIIFVTAATALISSLAHATLFRNSYISFELPPAWKCKPDATDWICTNTYSRAAKEAIIVFTAKEAGPADTLQNYEDHLKIAKSLPKQTGGFSTSTVEVVTQRMINGQPWIDGMQLGSEVNQYYTRYLATTKDNIAILVTFSAQKDYYTKYSADFINAIGSLRVVAAKDILSNPSSSKMAMGSNETIGAPISPEAFSGPTNVPPVPSANGRDGLATKLFALALILGVAGIYLWRKKHK